jgi:hypothetical protein
MHFRIAPTEAEDVKEIDNYAAPLRAQPVPHGRRQVTPTQLYRATWIPHPLPDGEQVELVAPWTTNAPKARVLTAVRIDGEIFVVARNPDSDEVIETWKVLQKCG